VYGNSKEMDQELHQGLLFILRKCTRSSTEDLCLYSQSKVYGTVSKWKRSSSEDLCLSSILKVYGISKEMEQKLMLIYSIKSVWYSEQMEEELL
jgi:hypothetical protein